MTINKMPALKRAVDQIIKTFPVSKFPQTLFYKEGFEHTKYRINIDIVEENSFIDANGRKWIREDKIEQEKEEDESN